MTPSGHLWSRGREGRRRRLRRQGAAEAAEAVKDSSGGGRGHYSELCGVTYDDETILNSITETHRIAFECIESFTPDNTVRLPDFVVPAGTDATTYLGQLSFEGLVKLFEDRQIESQLAKEKRPRTTKLSLRNCSNKKPRARSEVS